MMSTDSVPRTGSSSSVSSGSPADEPCAEFKPQRWRLDTCSNCFRKKLEHANSLLEEQLSKDDPSEMFEVISMIGYGSFGSVYLCRNKITRKKYAIKMLELKEKQNDIPSIVNEINIMKESLECPYVVEYSGCYMRNDTLMIVMQYCACSLADILYYCPEMKPTELQIAAICAQTLKGLVYLHANDIGHRDIKPGNILLTEEGEIKLADFSISVKLRNKTDKMNKLAGSSYWLAPEVITDATYDKKVDIWSLAIVAIELAEGHPPLFHLDPYQVIYRIPTLDPPKLQKPEMWSSDFNDFLERCLKKNPKERASAKDLLLHPFILQGASSQILTPLMAQCLPTLTTRKKAEMKQKKGKKQRVLAQGTLLTLDRTTYMAAYVNGLQSPSSDKTLGIELNIVEILRRDGDTLNELMDLVRVKALDVDLIFSMAGDQIKIAEVKEQLRNHKPVDFAQLKIHDIAGVFKSYIFEFNEPVVTAALYKPFLDLNKCKDKKLQASSLKSLIDQLPVECRKFLAKFLSLLNVIKSYEAINGMSATALSRTFTPLLFLKRVASQESIYQEFLMANELLLLLMENAKLFEATEN